MRRTVIAGNWKMNKNLSEAVSLISDIKNGLQEISLNADVIICPPYTSLETANALIKDSAIKLGAQNMCSEESGAFTGEISAEMLLSVGCEYVILGHSERRSIYNESDELINKKIKLALLKGLKVIFCFGESLDEREKGIAFDIVKSQIESGLANISENDLNDIIFAYEPVWAIGTGKTASPEQAEEIHAFIRNLVKQNYSQSAADNLVIQYGGSVKPANSKELLSQNNIDGALVGGACLESELFLGIIKSA